MLERRRFDGAPQGPCKIFSYKGESPSKTQKIVEKVRFAMSFQLEKLSED